jgi:hypothetical protein
MTADAGCYVVERHWHQHAVYDLAENPPPVAAGPYPTRDQAQAAADQLNAPAAPAAAPPRQGALFDHQEA